MNPLNQPPAPRFCLHICDGPSCGVMHESEHLVRFAEGFIAERALLRERVNVRNYTCFGRCDDGPNLFVQQLGPGEDGLSDPELEVLETQRGFYSRMDAEKLARILERHCGHAETVEDLVEPY